MCRRPRRTHRRPRHALLPKRTFCMRQSPDVCTCARQPIAHKVFPGMKSAEARQSGKPTRRRSQANQPAALRTPTARAIQRRKPNSHSRTNAATPTTLGLLQPARAARTTQQSSHAYSPCAPPSARRRELPPALAVAELTSLLGYFAAESPTAGAQTPLSLPNRRHEPHEERKKTLRNGHTECDRRACQNTDPRTSVIFLLQRCLPTFRPSALPPFRLRHVQLAHLPIRSLKPSPRTSARAKQHSGVPRPGACCAASCAVVYQPSPAAHTCSPPYSHTHTHTHALVISHPHTQHSPRSPVPSRHAQHSRRSSGPSRHAPQRFESTNGVRTYNSFNPARRATQHACAIS